jgi:hypothetical protein
VSGADAGLRGIIVSFFRGMVAFVSIYRPHEFTFHEPS